MANEQTRQSFFILLGLDPSEAWSESKFEEALKKKRGQWSLDASGVAKTALSAQKNLRLIPEIRKVMLDPVLRKAEAQAAKQERTSGRKEKIQKFEKEIAIAQKKGYLEETELASYIKEFKDILTEPEIRKYIHVEIRKVSANAEKRVQMLDASIMGSITDNLKHLHIQDLYALFDMSHTTSNAELSAAATKLAANMRDKQPKDDDVTARAILAGHAKNIFSSEEMRKKYDESLRHASLEALFEILVSTVNHTTTKEVHASQVADFIEQARKVGFAPEEALARLKQGAAQHKWSITIPTDSVEPKQRCGACQEINGMERKYCSGCGGELSFSCPGCSKIVSSDEVRCNACGFPVGNWDRVDGLLKHIDQLLTLSTSLNEFTQVLEVQDLLTVAERVWRPDHAMGTWSPKTSDIRTDRIQQYKTKISNLLKEKQAKIDKIRLMIDRREFFAAQQFLTTLTTQDGIDLRPYRTTIETKTSEATSLVKRAQASLIRPEERFELCRKALKLCIDCQNARDLLGTFSLTPPSNVQAKKGEMLVSLTWDSSPMDDIKYKIIRKAGSHPVSVNDGVVLATVAGCLYDDTKPEVGMPLYYAVFSECEGVTSTQYATLEHPILLTQDVSNEVVQFNDRMITLSWHIPPNVHTVLVIRKEHTAPRHINDGALMLLLSLNHLVDRSVQNNIPYFYRIYCQFKNFDGNFISSAGKTICATAETPPDAITELQITHTKVGRKYEVHIAWKRPAKGNRVVIVRAEQQIPCKAGDVIPAAKLSQYGQVLEGGIDTLTDTWNRPGLAYYMPVVLSNNMAYVGSIQRYVCMEEVRDLHNQSLGSTIRLLWTWPDNCLEVLVSYSYSGWPQSGGAVRSRTISRAEYDHKGHFDIRGLENQDCYIIVACVFRNGSERIISDGVKTQARIASKTVICYEIKNPRFLHPRRILHIYIRTPGTMPMLPAFLLVTKRNGLPFDKRDGEPLQEIVAGLSGNKKEHSVMLTNRSFPVNTFAKLFLKDEDLYEIINIHHDEESMRIS